MEEITVKYIDFTDLLDPKVIEGFFYIDYKPTAHSVPRVRRAFTIDGRPVTLGNLRLVENRTEDTESEAEEDPLRRINFHRFRSNWEFIADHVEFPDRPSIYADVDPTRGQGGEYNPTSPRPRDPLDKFKWPNSPCWTILEVDRTKLPDDESGARAIVVKNFRELTKKHHPDLPGGSADAMKQVIAARAEAENIFGHADQYAASQP